MLNVLLLPLLAVVGLVCIAGLIAVLVRVSRRTPTGTRPDDAGDPPAPPQ